jgi:hypothetical protein
MNVVRRTEAEMNIKNASVFCAVKNVLVSLPRVGVEIHTAREESGIRGLMLLDETSTFTIRVRL